MELEKEFEIKSKLNRLISVTKDYWKIITKIKHPIIKGKQNLVMKTLVILLIGLKKEKLYGQSKNIL